MGKSLLEVFKNKRDSNSIIGKGRKLLTGVLIGIVTMAGKEYIVLEKRASGIRQGGEISFPGGRFELNDIDTRHTAIRETSEELGIPISKIEVFSKFGILVNPSGIILETYIGKIDIHNLDEMKYNKDEVERVILVPIEFFIKTPPRVEKIGVENIPLFSVSELKLPQRYEGSWPGIAREAYFYNYEGEVIWGMTAEIIYEFIESIKGELTTEGAK